MTCRVTCRAVHAHSTHCRVNFFYFIYQFLIWKSIIGRFSKKKWAKRPPDRRFQVHFLFENRSLVDFQIDNERKGRQIGGFRCISYLKIDLWSIFKNKMSEKAARSEVSGAFPIWKSIIGRFSNRKLAKRPPDRRFQVHFLFENRSLVDFQTRNERGRRPWGVLLGCSGPWQVVGVREFSKWPRKLLQVFRRP